ncbi:MAG: CopG family transcriptional regulator [Gemmatimonadota bacterium]
MADEAECGYVVHTLESRRRGRPMLGSAPSEVVPVRLDPDLRLAGEARAEAEHTTTSEIIREALSRFLDVA